MKLYLMRHGQAASFDIDPEQGLSVEGKKGIENLAQKLSARNITFQKVFHSEKTRARQTAEIMTNILAPGVTPEQKANLRPNDDPEKLLPDLNAWQQDTLIASHLPFVPMLLQLLTGSTHQTSFSPGTIVCLSKSGPQWQFEWADQP